MRLIDNIVTGNNLDLLADEYFSKICPKNNNRINYNASYLAGKLEKLADPKKSKTTYYKVFKYLFDNIEVLIKGTPSELIKFSSDFETYLNNEGIPDYPRKPYCKKILDSIFINSYTNFRGGGFNNYNQVWFDKLNLRTCPYCNRNWITKSLDKDNTSFKLYFDIDHFWPKSKYPWFAASFSNLIPSCVICNQRIKHSDDLDSDNYLHPYKDDMDAIIKFEVPAESYDIFYNKSTPINLKIVPRQPRTLMDPDFVKALNTFTFFNLKNLYNTHLDYVRELMQKDIIYSESYIEQLFNDYGPSNPSGKIFDSKEDLMKMLIGNYVLSEQIHERPLAKLTKDILEDFSLNKTI